MLALCLVGALFMAFHQSREAKRQRKRAEDFRSKIISLEISKLELSEKLDAEKFMNVSLQSLTNSFDILSDDPENPVDNATVTALPGEPISVTRPMALVDPERLAKAAAALKNSKEKNNILSTLKAENMDIKSENRRLEFSLVRVRGTRPWYFVAGFVVGSGVTLIATKL
jgi:hypothetical protein